MSKTEKNRYGQYFTRQAIASYMVSLIRHSKDCRVLEPSCGKGVFLQSLNDEGYNNVKGYEVDVSLNSHLYESVVEYKSFLSVPTSEKYEVVIGNPPYIRWKNLEKELKNELQECLLWQRYFNSLCDYLYIFILKSIEHLVDGGELIFICSDYWFTTSNAQSLRNYMCQNGSITDIWHFKEASLFDGVTASLAIFRYVKGNAAKSNKLNLYSYRSKSMPEMNELKSLACFEHTMVNNFTEGEKWLLADNETQRALVRFEMQCQSIENNNLFGEKTDCIGDFFDIGNGMVSGLDKAFAVSDDKENVLTDSEKRCSIKVIKAKSIGQYLYTSPTRYIYVKDEICAENFNQRFPNYAEMLLPYIEDLNKRYNYGRDLHYWEFAFPRNEKLFKRKEAKIFVPCKERISNKDYVRFCYAPEGFYPLQDVTALVQKTNCKESIEYALAYLNTSQVFTWIKYKGTVKGDIVEFSEAPLASIPYRRIDWNNQKEVALHDEITQTVRDLLIDNDYSHIVHLSNLFNSLLC